MYEWKCLFHSLVDPTEIYYLNSEHELYNIVSKAPVDFQKNTCIEAINEYKTIFIKHGDSLRHLTENETTKKENIFEYDGFMFELRHSTEIGDYTKRQ